MESAGLSAGRAVDIATRLAMLVQRGIHEPAIEPGLWEVDPNLRPEGKDGALVRTLESHIAYYDRWAKRWEFQALLKARPLAGDADLGSRYVAALAPKVWCSASRENFVESVQRMRERVTENIPDDEVHYQLKLGPGGLRDVEFTVQLLQLVHGQTDELVRQRDTLAALAALAAQGYIGREEAAAFSQDYRMLRLLEHRLQLRHLQPHPPHAARRGRRAGTGPGDWAGDERRAVAGALERDQAPGPRPARAPVLPAAAERCGGVHGRQWARGRDCGRGRCGAHQRAGGGAARRDRVPRPARRAARTSRALTAGVSRRATIQRHLLPVLLQWFAEGADPDYGLLTFRRLSEDLGSTHWYLRMLRDSTGAAERLTRVLSGSRFVGELLGASPSRSPGWSRRRTSARARSRCCGRRPPRPGRSARVGRTRRRRCARSAGARCCAWRSRSILGLCTIEELARAL